MCDNDEGKSLAEQQAESEQRAYELGKRYGHLDARSGVRRDLGHPADQMSLSGREAELYKKGWHESYDWFMHHLTEPGHHLSVPGLEPGERMLATTTGNTRTDADGLLHVEMLTPDGTSPIWLAVNLVRVIR